MRPTHFPFKRAPSSPATTSSHLLPFGRASFILKEILFFCVFRQNIRNLSWLPLRSRNASNKLKYCKTRQTTMRKRLKCFPSNLATSYCRRGNKKNDLMAFNLSQRTSNIQEIADNRGVVHSQKSSYTPQKNPKNPKNPRIFLRI